MGVLGPGSVRGGGGRVSGAGRAPGFGALEAPSLPVPATVAMLPRRQCGSPGRCSKLCLSDETFGGLVLKVKSRGTLFLTYFF